MCCSHIFCSPYFLRFNDNSDFPSVHCHIKLKLRQFACVLLSLLYLHFTWKSIIRSYTNWIIRLTLTAYFSSIAISRLPLKAVELKRSHAFILCEHVGFLSSQCIINLLQRVEPNYRNRFISIWKPHFSSSARVVISKMLHHNDLQSRSFHPFQGVTDQERWPRNNLQQFSA